jgi:hypothetical protein
MVKPFSTLETRKGGSVRETQGGSVWVAKLLAESRDTMTS